MNIKQIGIVSMPVKDQQVAKAFYTEKLGFSVLRDDPFGDQRWIQLAPSGAQTSITLVVGGTPMSPGTQQGLVLYSTDVQTDHKTLKERGVSISEVENAPWGAYATFTDPDGNGWVLQQITM